MKVYSVRYRRHAKCAKENKINHGKKNSLLMFTWPMAIKLELCDKNFTQFTNNNCVNCAKYV